jgi:hypothetical protein
VAGRRAKPPGGVERVVAVEVADTQTDRALTRIRETLERLDSARKRDVVKVDLIVGTNKVRHGLGRPVAGYSITATVADATFAHAIDRDNPRPELEVWITVAGIAMPNAIVEVF